MATYIPDNPSFSPDFDPSGLTEVEPRRRLIASNMGKIGVAEFVVAGSRNRVITLDADSEQARIHSLLAKPNGKNIPLLDARQGSNKLMLSVPSGTRTVHTILKSVARDTHTYKQIFNDTGKVLAAIEDRNIGLPIASKERPLLSGMAFIYDKDDYYGGRTVLIPPYVFSDTTAKSEVLASLESELRTSCYFNGAQINELVEEVDYGWNT